MFGFEPSVVFGTQMLSASNALVLCREAWGVGIRTFDCALSYGNQTHIAPFFAGIPDRLSFRVVSKIRRQHIDDIGVRQAVSTTIEQLGLKFIDVVLIHAPKGVDHFAVLTELDRLRGEGVLRYFGVSNYTIRHLLELERAGLLPHVVQNEIHPFLQEPALVKFCLERDVAIMAHTSFARGAVFANPALVNIAIAEGVSVSNLTLQWHLARGVSPAFSSLNPEHIGHAFVQAGHVLSVNAQSAIEELDGGVRLCSHPSWAEFDN